MLPSDPWFNVHIMSNATNCGKQLHTWLDFCFVSDTEIHRQNMSSSHIQSQVCERSSWIDFSFWCWLFSVATPIRSSWVFSRPAPVSQKLVGTGCRRLQLACLWSWKRYGRVEFHYDTYHPSPWTRTMICILQEASMQLILWSVHIMTTSHSAMFGSFWQHRVKHLLIIRLHHFFFV